MLAGFRRSVTMTTTNQRREYWREAASIILCAYDINIKQDQQNSQFNRFYDYKLLMLKRSPKSRFLPNNLVFPGGVVSPVDYSNDWQSLYLSISGWTLDEIAQNLHISGERPPCVQNTSYWGISPDVVFRICSIRETFEESGILLARGKNDSLFTSPKSVRPFNASAYDNDVHFKSLAEYRCQIQKDDAMFLEMCKALEVVPDIWSLNEWNNYLTPVMPHSSSLTAPPDKPYRFDTLFYLCCVSYMPKMMHDQQEMVESKWLNPCEMLDSPECQEQLITPQIYEIGRLCNISENSKVARHARLREEYGVSRDLVVIAGCADGYLELKEGDDLYPAEPDLEGRHPMIVFEKSNKELLRDTRIWDRIYYSSASERTTSRVFYRRNTVRKHEHHQPLLPNTVKRDFNSLDSSKL